MTTSSPCPSCGLVGIFHKGTCSASTPATYRATREALESIAVPLQMTQEEHCSFRAFPGTQAQWSDSLKRSVAFRLYRENSLRRILLDMAFYDVPYNQRPLALSEYARSIGL